MKPMKQIASICTLCLTLGTGVAHAFDMPQLPGTGAGGSSVNAAKLVVNARNSLYAFAMAETGLAKSLGGYSELAAQQKLLAGLKAGDAAAKKEDIETLVTIHKSAGDAISKKIAENAKFDAKNKGLAGKSILQYVTGLVSSKKLISSIQGATKNPTALGTDAPAALYVAKELPSIVSSGTSSTSALFKYLGANGVDLTAAKKAAASLGT